MVRQNVFAQQNTSAMRRALRRFMRSRGDGIRGVAAIEFAVIGSALVLMTIGTADLGMGFFRNMQVQNAAQAGAQYAAENVAAYGFNATAISAAVTSATSATQTANFSGISAFPAPFPFCGCPSSAGVTVLYVLPPSNPLPPCTSCPDGSTAGTYVTVSAQGTYYTILPYPPLIPSSFLLPATSTVRIL